METRKWDIKVSETSEVAYAQYQGKNGSWLFMVGTLTEYNIDMFSWFPTECPEEKLNVCAELIARINHTLAGGHFEMSFENRYIKFTSWVPYKKRLPSLNLLKMMLSLNLRTMDCYLPVIKQVIEFDVSPIAVLAELPNIMDLAKDEKPKSQNGLNPDDFIPTRQSGGTVHRRRCGVRQRQL